MSKFREWTPKPSKDDFRWEDRQQIKKLMETNKLTDRQREAIRRLLASYDYMLD